MRRSRCIILFFFAWAPVVLLFRICCTALIIYTKLFYQILNCFEPRSAHQNEETHQVEKAFTHRGEYSTVFQLCTLFTPLRLPFEKPSGSTSWNWSVRRWTKNLNTTLPDKTVYLVSVGIMRISWGSAEASLECQGRWAKFFCAISGCCTGPSLCATYYR